MLAVLLEWERRYEDPDKAKRKAGIWQSAEQTGLPAAEFREVRSRMFAQPRPFSFSDEGDATQRCSDSPSPAPLASQC